MEIEKRLIEEHKKLLNQDEFEKDFAEIEKYLRKIGIYNFDGKTGYRLRLKAGKANCYQDRVEWSIKGSTFSVHYKIIVDREESLPSTGGRVMDVSIPLPFQAFFEALEKEGFKKDLYPTDTEIGWSMRKTIFNCCVTLCGSWKITKDE